MALHLPPSVSVNRFIGGYKAVSDYTDLADTETNDSKNVNYGPNGNIEQRLGCEKLLNQRLANAATPTVGEPITGHYWFSKLGTSAAHHVVAAGDSIYRYTTSTAVAIRTGLTDSSNTFWTFCQIQDPRSASDEIAIFANGVDPIQVWNGTATAVALSSFTSASQVPVGKYVLQHKERVYVMNILDSTDADAGVKVAVSGFGSDGAADPHRFGTNVGGGSFYCGAGGRSGDIRGGKVLNDQIVIYTRKSVWKFSPGTGSILDTGSLREMEEAHGLLAPGSLVDIGHAHIFLSEQGVYAFDGVNFVHMSEKVDDDIFNDSNLGQLQFAKAVYYKNQNQYVLYYPSSGQDRNDTALTYDIRLKIWLPPVTGRRVSFLSTFDPSSNAEELIFGDYGGYLYQDHKSDNDGLAIGYNGTATAGSITTITDGAAAFPTTNDGLSGLMVRIIGGTGENQERVIASNTGTQITVENAWDTPPDTTSLYTVGGIDAAWKSKDYAFGSEDITKLFRHVRVRAKEVGSYSLVMHYMVNFRELTLATSRDISMIDGGAAYGVAVFGADRYGAKETISRKVSLRNTANQRLNGTHLALRFANGRANETFQIKGFDIEFKPVLGKR